MIQRLHTKDALSIYDFILNCQDRFEEFYFTKNKDRIFCNNIKIINKLLKSQEIYALCNPEVKGLLFIYREKTFRPYAKFLAKDSNTEWALVKFFNWNFSEEIYAKLKQDNPLVRRLLKIGFIEKGYRGAEILLYKPKTQKRINNYYEKKESI
jgi:hypothetical protein